MVPEAKEEPIQQEVAPRIRRSRPLATWLMLDVIRDPESRPVFYWALGALLTGTLAYHWLEGWSYLDALYFCVVSLATVGYGDLTPRTPYARAFTILYLINGIVILLALFDRIRIVRSREMADAAARRKAS
jgi:voltage-gated potassium channel